MQPFNYLVPALFWNATVTSTVNLGATDGNATFGITNFISATLQSEPGFTPQFTAQIKSAANYVARDPGSQLTRIEHSGLVVPDNGDTPFRMQATAILVGNAEVIKIVTSAANASAIPWGGVNSVWVPTFTGGSAAFATLRNSVFVASEAFSPSTVPGQFFIALRISQVLCTNTSVHIGEVPE